MLIETNWLNILVDRGESKGYVIQADQIWFGNHIPGHLAIVLIEGDTSFHGAWAHSGPRPPHCRGFTITLRHTAHGRTPLDEWSVRRRDRYLYNTQHSQETDIHAPGGIRSRNPSKRTAADPRLRPRGHWDRHCWRGCKHEQWRWSKTDIPFDWLESYLLFSWMKTDMILKPSSDRGRKLTFRGKAVPRQVEFQYAGWLLLDT
jgi:hypothetical protein